jgi:hypothetical protein
MTSAMVACRGPPVSVRNASIYAHVCPLDPAPWEIPPQKLIRDLAPSHVVPYIATLTALTLTCIRIMIPQPLLRYVVEPHIYFMCQ